jgi:hypothetical protein
MPEFRVTYPIIVSTIENAPLITVQGTVGVGSVNVIVDVGTINAVIDVATIQSLGTIESPVAVSGIVTPIIVATIENAPLVTVQGTMTATLESNVVVSTIETAPLVTVQGTVDVSNLEQPSLSGAVQNFDIPVGTVASSLSADTSLIYELTILADASNTATVFVGSATLQTFPLRAGASITLGMVLPSNVYVMGNAPSQIVHVIYGGS